jgi:hypothetical protein
VKYLVASTAASALCAPTSLAACQSILEWPAEQIAQEDHTEKMQGETGKISVRERERKGPKTGKMKWRTR